jgi:hypothetical protein
MAPKKTAEAGFASNLEQVLEAEVRAAQGRFELSTGNRLCLATGCRERKQNTRYCGLLLTCTTDSAIFSSATLIRL